MLKQQVPQSSLSRACLQGVVHHRRIETGLSDATPFGRLPESIQGEALAMGCRPNKLSHALYSELYMLHRREEVRRRLLGASVACLQGTACGRHWLRRCEKSQLALQVQSSRLLRVGLQLQGRVGLHGQVNSRMCAGLHADGHGALPTQVAQDLGPLRQQSLLSAWHKHTEQPLQRLLGCAGLPGQVDGHVRARSATDGHRAHLPSGGLRDSGPLRQEGQALAHAPGHAGALLLA